MCYLKFKMMVFQHPFILFWKRSQMAISRALPQTNLMKELLQTALKLELGFGETGCAETIKRHDSSTSLWQHLSHWFCAV